MKYLLVVLLLAGCGIEDEFYSTDNLYIEDNIDFTIKYTFESEKLTDRVRIWWQETNDCMNESYTVEGFIVEYLNGHEVTIGKQGKQQGFSITVTKDDLKTGHWTRHEFQHFIKWLRGESDSDNKKHVNWIQC